MVVKAPITELSNLRPDEVSIVGKPANKKEFLIVKNANGGKEMSKNMGADGKPLNKEELEKVLKSAKVTMEGLSSLTVDLEKMQGEKDTDKNAFDSVIVELQKTNAQLTQVVTALAHKEEDDGKTDDGKSEGDEMEGISKKFEEITKGLEGLSGKIELIKKASDKKDDKEEDPKDDVKKSDDKKSDDKPFDKEAFIADVSKAMDERAIALTGKFQEAAQESFGGMLTRLDNVEKFLRNPEEKEVEDKDYKRNFGITEDGVDVEDADNPFATMFGAMS